MYIETGLHLYYQIKNHFTLVILYQRIIFINIIITEDNSFLRQWLAVHFRHALIIPSSPLNCRQSFILFYISKSTNSLITESSHTCTSLGSLQEIKLEIGEITKKLQEYPMQKHFLQSHPNRHLYGSGPAFYSDFTCRNDLGLYSDCR